MTSLSFPGSAVVRIITGHSVASTSLMDRAYLRDSWSGVVARGLDDRLWLVSTVDALAPDQDRLRIRGEANGGPPPSGASVTLAKILLSWTGADGRFPADASAEVPRPRVVVHPHGVPVAVVSLDRVRGFAAGIREGSGPVPVAMDAVDLDPRAGDAVGDLMVSGAYEADDGSLWGVTRRAAVASHPDGGFAGIPGAVALDVRLDKTDSGSPVFSQGPGGADFCGVARPVAAGMSVLLPAACVAEVVTHACQQLPPPARSS